MELKLSVINQIELTATDKKNQSKARSGLKPANQRIPPPAMHTPELAVRKPPKTRQCIILDSQMQPNAQELQNQLLELQQKESLWKEQRQQLFKTISLLQQQLSKQKAVNGSLLKRSHHKRTSSEEKTFIFNQTNISSYYPVVMLKNNTLNHKATLRSHLDSVRALTFVGNRLVTAGEDATLKIWVNDTLELTLRDHLGPVYAITATNDHLFTAGAEGVVRKWSLQDLQQGLPPCFQGDFHQQPIWSLACNKANDLLLTSSADQSFKLFKNAERGLNPLWTSKLDKETPTAVEWIAENRFVAGYRNQSKLGVFQISQGELSWEYPFDPHSQPSQANSLQFSPSLKMLAAGHEDHFLRFYDPNTNKRIKQIAAHSDSVTGVHFSRQGFELLSCGQDGNLRVWDLRKYKCMSDYNVHVRKYEEGALCLGEGGEGTVAVGGADGLVKLFARGNQ